MLEEAHVYLSFNDARIVTMQLDDFFKKSLMQSAFLKVYSPLIEGMIEIIHNRDRVKSSRRKVLYKTNKTGIRIERIIFSWRIVESELLKTRLLKKKVQLHFCMRFLQLAFWR